MYSHVRTSYRSRDILAGILYFENISKKTIPRIVLFLQYANFTDGIYDPTVLFIRRVLITNYVTRFTCVTADMKIATRLLYTHTCTREVVWTKLRRLSLRLNPYGDSDGIEVIG